MLRPPKKEALRGKAKETSAEGLACLMSGMTSRWILGLVMALCLGGCGKRSHISPSTPVSSAPGSSASISTGAPATSPLAEQAAAPAITAKPASEAELFDALGELTQVLRKFSAEKQRVPKTLDEVVAGGYLKHLPQAPAGKRFAIKESSVEVVLMPR